MSVERDRPSVLPEPVDGRVALLRRLATVSGRESVMEESLSGRTGETGREYLDLLGRSMMLRSARHLAQTSGRPFEESGPRDAVLDRQAQGYARTMQDLATVSGRETLASRMASGAPSPTAEEGRRLEALGRPDGRDEQMRQARDYAAFYKTPFEAVQPGEHLFTPDAPGVPVRDRTSLLAAMETAQGRRDLVVEARSTGAIGAQGGGPAREGYAQVMADLRDPSRRTAVFEASRAAALAGGRPFESLEQDAGFHRGGDRARAEVFTDLATRHGRESLMREAVAWGQPSLSGDLGESTGFAIERHRLVRGLSAPETRQPILGEAEAYARHSGRPFESIGGDEEIAVRNRFNPGMGLGRTADLEVGGASNFLREHITSMIGRIDGGLSQAPAGREAALAEARLGREI